MIRRRFSEVGLSTTVRKWMALACVAMLVSGSYVLPSKAQEAAPAQADQKVSADELDSLVAPIALYPDPLLSQVLVASTYPLEVIQLKQWLDQNQNLKDKALADAVQKQDWDPSIQALAALPDVVKQLADNIKWTTDLGNAVLAQESDVMDAVQRMRAKAEGTGSLKSTEQQKVETQTVEDKSVIVIQPTNPEVVYVPSYNPTVVYGAAPYYPYPPMYYPTGGLLLSFGVGVAMGAFWSGGWGWGCGWGGGNINVNNNNSFVRNSNRNSGNVGGGDRGGNRGDRGNGNRGDRGNGNRGNGTWQHNPKHRGGAPYSNRDLASKYGGTARGESRGRQGGASQLGQSGRGGFNGGGGGGFNGGGAGGFGGGGDRVGNRQVPNTPGSGNRGAFSGAGSGMSGRSAGAASSRGRSSMGGSRGGGGGRGGGGRGRGR